ncbi:hypothetical protein GCM10027093_25640 [Paraburkholderia jirisanensis]
MQTTSQNPIVNTNYFFSGSQLTENQQGATGVGSAGQEGDDNLEGRIPGKTEGMWRKVVSAQLGEIGGKLDSLATGQTGINNRLDSVASHLEVLDGQVGNLNSQLTAQARRLNGIDNAVRSSNVKLDKLSANDDAMAAALGQLGGQLGGVDARLGKVDDSLKVLAAAQGAANLQLAGLNGKVDAGFSALAKAVQSQCTTPIPHSSNRAQQTQQAADQDQSSQRDLDEVRMRHVRFDNRPAM